MEVALAQKPGSSVHNSSDPRQWGFIIGEVNRDNAVISRELRGRLADTHADAMARRFPGKSPYINVHGQLAVLTDADTRTIVRLAFLSQDPQSTPSEKSTSLSQAAQSAVIQKLLAVPQIATLEPGLRAVHLLGVLQNFAELEGTPEQPIPLPDYPRVR